MTQMIESKTLASSNLYLPSSAKQTRRLLWLHDTGRMTGGCESYISNTAELLRERGFESTLLYGESGTGPLDLLTRFERSFPVVDLAKQLDVIQPDLIYAHRISGEKTLQTLAKSGVPTLRFFHDHKLFCPREHKYTVVKKETCRQTIGAGCYRCMGVVTRSENWPGVRLTTVGSLRDEQRAHHPLAGYVVGSQYMADHLVDHGFNAEKTHVLPLYANPTPDTLAMIRDTKHLLFVGQLVRGKGLDVLLRALSRVNGDVRLTVVGSGVQADEFRDLSHSLGLSKRVEFVGRKMQNEVADYYRSAGCLVFPSRSPETFGQVGVEAMSYGMPSIATDVGGISQWLEDGVNGILCRSNDETGLATAIERFVNEPRLAYSMSVNARRIYSQQFRPEFHADRLAGLLSRTIEQAEVVK